MIKNFILLTGSDDFRLSQRKNFFLKAFKNKYPDGEINFFEEKDDVFELENALLTPNLFASKRLVVTQNFWNPDNFESCQNSKIFERLPQMEDSITLISCENALDKRTKMAKFLLQTAKIEKFDPLDESQLIQWIINFTESEGGFIQMSDARFLLHRCGENAWNLSQEIKKCLTCAEDKTITRPIIESLTLPHPKVVIWDFLAFLSQKKAQQTIEKFRELRQLGEVPHMIFAMIIREIRIHTQILAGLNEGLSQKEISSTYSIHPFVIQKTLPLSKKFTLKQLAQIYDELCQIDKKLKTGGISVSTNDQSEFELAIEKFIIEICKK